MRMLIEINFPTSLRQPPCREAIIRLSQKLDIETNPWRVPGTAKSNQKSIASRFVEESISRCDTSSLRQPGYYHTGPRLSAQRSRR